MPAQNRYLNEIQRASARMDRHEAATRRGAKNVFQTAPEWLMKVFPVKWSPAAVLVETPAGRKWIPLSALRAIRNVNGKDMVIPFGASCDGERREIASWWMEQNFPAES